MSTATATNGARIGIGNPFEVIAKAADAAGSLGPVVIDAADKAKAAGESWLEQSKELAALALDAFDASVTAYLEYTKSIAAAIKFTERVTSAAELNATIVSELAETYSNAARSLLTK
jgi:hypothetical protein